MGFAIGWGATRVGLDETTAAALTIGPVVVGAAGLLGQLARDSGMALGLTTMEPFAPSIQPPATDALNGGYVAADPYRSQSNFAFD